RRLAAELEVDALERVRGVTRDRLAGRDVSREGDEANVGMRDEALANGDAVARDDAQHAGGQNVLRELGEAKERQRRLLGGLEDLAVPRGDCRSELPDRHHER